LKKGASPFALMVTTSLLNVLAFQGSDKSELRIRPMALYRPEKPSLCASGLSGTPAVSSPT